MHYLISILLIVLLHLLINCLFNINFIMYFKNSFDIINYYNDAMLLNSSTIIIYTAFILIFLFSSFVLFYCKVIFKSKYELFLFINLYILLYIVFKQSFVRADLEHTSTLFYSVTYVLLFIFVFTNSSAIKNYTLTLIPIAVVFCSFVPLFKPNAKPNIYDIISNKIHNQKKPADKKNEKLLTCKILNKIGNQTTDIVPSEISWVYFNKLNYNPRPIIQSYSAYSKELMDLNYNKYLSASAPEFVIYHNNGFIDNHYPLWEDAFIPLALLQHYNLVDTAIINTDSLILFEKKASIAAFTKKLILDTTIALNQIVSLPKTNKLLFMECSLHYNLSGKIRRVFFQPTNVNLEIKNENDTFFNTYTAILPILNAGVLINKSIKIHKYEYDSNADFNQLIEFFKTRGEKSVPISEIKFVANRNYFINSFRVKFWEYSL